MNASKLCLCVCCLYVRFRIIIFLLRVTVVTSRKHLESLPWRTWWWSFGPWCLVSLSLLSEPLATNLLVGWIILLALGTALRTFLRYVLRSWFFKLRFDISLCARVSSFFSSANCGSKPSDLPCRPLCWPNGTLLLVSAWASIARSWHMPSSNKHPTCAPLIVIWCCKISPYT